MKRELAKLKEAVESGSAQEAMLARKHQAEIEEERERRVAHLAQVGLRRIMQHGLARGWNAWHDLWVDISHTKRLLAASAAPCQTEARACGEPLGEDWEVEAARVRELSTAELLTEMKSKKESAEAELRQVRTELVEARKAMAEGRGMEMELQRQHELQLEEERQKRVEHLAKVGMRRIMQQGLAKAGRRGMINGRILLTIRGYLPRRRVVFQSQSSLRP